MLFIRLIVYLVIAEGWLLGGVATFLFCYVYASECIKIMVLD